MKDTLPQLALRELQGSFTSPRLLTGMAAVGLVLGLSGPFNTAEAFGLAQRIVYWLAMVVLTFGLCRPLAVVVLTLLRRRFGAGWGPVLATGVLIGTPVFAVVAVVNLVAIGQVAAPPLELWVNCTLITVAAMIVGTLLRQGQRPTMPPPATAPQDGAADAVAAPPEAAGEASTIAPALLERLPYPVRGDLVALSVRDHYVEVVTRHGRHLLLMRLSDAIRETAPVAGVQIHRSHWVALDAVVRIVRSDGRVLVELPNGTRLPVSRGFLPAAREAGLVV